MFLLSQNHKQTTELELLGDSDMGLLHLSPETEGLVHLSQTSRASNEMC
jgi:hypothetical protein